MKSVIVALAVTALFQQWLLLSSLRDIQVLKDDVYDITCNLDTIDAVLNAILLPNLDDIKTNIKWNKKIMPNEALTEDTLVKKILETNSPPQTYAGCNGSVVSPVVIPVPVKTLAQN